MTQQRLTRTGVGCDDRELLPQPITVLARELGREPVDLAESLDGDEERFVIGETRRLEVGDLLAQMPLELVGISGIDRLGLAARQLAIRRFGSLVACAVLLILMLLPESLGPTARQGCGSPCSTVCAARPAGRDPRVVIS